MRLGQRRYIDLFHRELWLINRDEFKPEHASHPDGAFHADDAPHQFDQSLGHHETDACAFLATRLLSETIERLKQLIQLFWRESRAAVFDADANASRRALGAFYFDGSMLAVVLDRIGKKVDENLFHASPISMHKTGYVEPWECHLYITLFRLRPDHALAFEHDIGQRYRLPRQWRMPGFDFREIENFVNQRQQMPSRLKNLGYAFHLDRRWRWRIGFHQLSKPEDSIERAAQ